jgi:hypothetical protein
VFEPRQLQDPCERRVLRYAVLDLVQHVTRDYPPVAGSEAFERLETTGTCEVAQRRGVKIRDPPSSMAGSGVRDGQERNLVERRKIRLLERAVE